uniref:Putative secreted protein n=1 Tax=Anopheles marajoara TaxID=58244 RepID=A0A2M4CF39_9DIPT
MVHVFVVDLVGLSGQLHVFCFLPFLPLSDTVHLCLLELSIHCSLFSWKYTPKTNKPTNTLIALITAFH